MGPDSWPFEVAHVSGTYRTAMRSKFNRWELVLLALFGTVVASFLSATAYSQYRAAAIDERARRIADEVSPSIECLATARADVRRLQAAAAIYARAPAADQAEALEKARVGWQALDDDLRRYAGLESHQQERDLWRQVIEPKLDEFKYSVRRILDTVQSGAGPDQDASARELTRTADEASTALVRGFELDASIAHDLAVRIARTREMSAGVGWLLDCLCTLTACGGAFILVRAHRRHATLVSAHAQLLEQLNQELEEFAGRVAHDISSPLTSIAMAFAMVDRMKVDRPELAPLVARGMRSANKVQMIVEGLLEFARAGAHPVADARANVKDAVDDVLLTSTASAERNRVTLASEPTPSCAVACNPGVLTSLLSNLVENAIKYMGDSPSRQVTVRVRDRGASIRVEVADTGPGIPSDLAPRMFNPYVRGTASKQPGIGLGLATVRRMAEAHGGSAGVETELGHGSTFWFELPIAVPMCAPIPIAPVGSPRDTRVRLA
jgi:signal transduction histidine kinase